MDEHTTPPASDGMDEKAGTMPAKTEDTEGCAGTIDRSDIPGNTEDTPINADSDSTVEDAISDPEILDVMTIKVPTPDEFDNAAHLLRQQGSESNQTVARYIEEIAKHGRHAIDPNEVEG